MRSFWWNEKLYRYTHHQLRNIWMTADVSRKKSYLWGGLATLAWICTVTQLTPPQQSRRIWPHLTMLVAAVAISKTTVDNVKKANETQKEVKNLLKGLRRAKNPLDVEEIRSAIGNLQRRYPIIHDYGKE